MRIALSDQNGCFYWDTIYVMRVAINYTWRVHFFYGWYFADFVRTQIQATDSADASWPCVCTVLLISTLTTLT